MTAIYELHIVTAQERTLHAMQEYMGVSLGNRVNKQGLWETSFIVARG